MICYIYCMSYEDLKKDFINNGAHIDGDIIMVDKLVGYQDMIINGQQHRQEQYQRVAIRYIGEGCVMGEDSEDDDIFYEFNLLDENGNPGDTICIDSFKDFKLMVFGEK